MKQVKIDIPEWLKYFNDFVDGSTMSRKYSQGCFHRWDDYYNLTPHYHWNYRGWVYVITGFIYFIISIVKIITSTKNENYGF